jgi:hypothetical protein
MSIPKDPPDRIAELREAIEDLPDKEEGTPAQNLRVQKAVEQFFKEFPKLITEAQRENIDKILDKYEKIIESGGFTRKRFHFFSNGKSRMEEKIKKFFYTMLQYAVIEDRYYNTELYHVILENSPDREHRTGLDKKEIVHEKLQKNLNYARIEQDEQKKTNFEHLLTNPPSVPENFNEVFATETLSCEKYSVGVCHAQGRRLSQQDRHLAISFDLDTGDGKKHPVQIFGVFDGHGNQGEKASSYASEQLKNKLTEQLQKSHLTDIEI